MFYIVKSINKPAVYVSDKKSLSEYLKFHSLNELCEHSQNARVDDIIIDKVNSEPPKGLEMWKLKLDENIDGSKLIVKVNKPKKNVERVKLTFEEKKKKLSDEITKLQEKLRHKQDKLFDLEKKKPKDV